MSRIQKLGQQITLPCLIENTYDLFYLTGLSMSKGRLLVTRSGATLFVDGRYYEKAKKEAPCPVLLWEEQKKITEKKIAFDSATVSYEGYLVLKKTFPDIEWVPQAHPVRNLRAIKEQEEIVLMRKAAQITWLGYKKVIECLQEGISEEELALEFEIFCRKKSASGMSFEPIIAFGENSAYPHYRAGKTRLQANQIVLVDVGAVVDHYHADMTRVHFFGKIDPDLAHLVEIVRTAQKKAVAQVKPGALIKDLDQVVRNEFDKANVKRLYIHSLGHGVGLQGHEYPLIRIDSPDQDVALKPGMVFTIEPGLYQPGLGGVRIEDTVLVTENGCENFYPN